MKKLFVILGLFMFVFNANAAIKMKNDTAAKFAAQNDMTVAAAEDEASIAILENDIRILDEEIAKCEKQKKGWIAATVIGGVGVAATGTAAIVQGVKIKEQKDTISDNKQEIKNLQQQSKDLDK